MYGDYDPVLEAYIKWSNRHDDRSKGKFIKNWRYKNWTREIISSDERDVWDALLNRWTFYEGIAKDAGVHYVVFDKDVYLPYKTGFDIRKVNYLLEGLAEKGLLRWTIKNGLAECNHTWERCYALFHSTKECLIWMKAEKNIAPIQYAGYSIPACLLPQVASTSVPDKIEITELPRQMVAGAGSGVGYVYLISSKDGYYKIGRSTTPVKRIRRLEVVLPFEIEVLHLIKCQDYVLAEGELHALYGRRRGRGEWFELSADELEQIKAIKEM